MSDNNSSPTIKVAGRTIETASQGLRDGALGPWGVFAQGLAAAAPSVAIAVVPISLFIAAGNGAAWAVVIGLVLVLLIAKTISFQAERTVSSGSLGTYTGNGLGPGFAYVAGWSLLLGYIGFATTGTLGGVLYLNAFLDTLGLGSQQTWFRLLLVAVIVSAAIYLPYRGVSLAAKYELVFEIVAVASIFVIIAASYIDYGFRVDWAQVDPVHLTSSATFVAAVMAVGSYAGFESVASLGAEASDAHRSISRALLRVVLILGALYLLATYPQVLQIDTIDGDRAILPQIATEAGVSWASYAVNAAVTIAFIVFVTAVTTAGARSLFTFAHEGALPKFLTTVHPQHKTPSAGILLIGALAAIFAVAASLSTAGRLIFDVYGGYVATWGFLGAYLLVLVATPLWLRKIKALTPFRLAVSVAAIVGLGLVIIANFVPVPEYPFNILPFVYLVLLGLGIAWYLYLRSKKPEVAARIGAIQRLSEEEQDRLATLGILEVLETDDQVEDENPDEHSESTVPAR